MASEAQVELVRREQGAREVEEVVPREDDVAQAHEA